VYHGARRAQAPDIVYLPDDLKINGFGLYQFSSNKWLERTFDRSGGHRMDGIFMMYGPGAQPGKEISGAHITDLAPTILAAMGVPIPDDMDGQVLTGAFVDGFFDERPITFIPAEEGQGASDGTGYSEEVEEEVKERLRALGYMA